MYSTGTCDYRHLCASIGTYVPIKFMYPLSIPIMHVTCTEIGTYVLYRYIYYACMYPYRYI